MARSKFEIYLRVLEVIKSGETKVTRIMSSANVSWIPLKKILTSMVRENLVEEFDIILDKRSRKGYKITEKGARYLNG